MKHLKKGRTLGRTRNQRRALIKTLLGSLVVREKMKTTEAKAKEIQPVMDRMITIAKRGKLDASRRVASLRLLGKRLPKMAMKKLGGEFLDRFEKRASGYTRITKLPRRKSDSAKMAVIEFIDTEASKQ